MNDHYDIHFNNQHEQDTLVNYLCDEIARILEGRADYDNRLEIFRNQYEGILAPKSFPFPKCSNVHIPVTSIAIEALHSRLMNAHFNVRPLFIVRANQKDFVGRTQPVEDFLEYIVDKEMDIFNVLDESTILALIQGTGAYKIIPSDVYHDTIINGKWALARKTVPTIYPVNMIDLVFSSDALSIQEATLVAHRLRISWQKLKEREKLGIYKKGSVDKIKSEAMPPSYYANLGQAAGIDVGQFTSLREKNKVIEYFEVYTTYDFNNDGIAEECIFIIAYKDKVLLKALVNPFQRWEKKPFVTYQVYKRPGHIAGIGVPEKIGSMQDQINTLYNQRNDSVTYDILKLFKYRTGAYDPEQYPLYPGAAIPLDDPNDLLPIISTMTPQTAYMEEPIIRDYIEKATGVVDYTLGGTGGRVRTGRGTATGTLALIQEANTRFDLLIKRHANALNKAASWVVQLCRQFFPAQIEFQKSITGEDYPLFVNIDRDQLMIDASYTVQSSTMTANKILQQQQMLNLYNFLSANPLVQQDPIRLYHLTQKVLVSLDIKDYENVIGTEQEWIEISQRAKQQQAMMQQQAMQQAMMQQQAGMNPMLAQQLAQQQQQIR